MPLRFFWSAAACRRFASLKKLTTGGRALCARSNLGAAPLWFSRVRVLTFPRTLACIPAILLPKESTRILAPHVEIVKPSLPEMPFFLLRRGELQRELPFGRALASFPQAPGTGCESVGPSSFLSSFGVSPAPARFPILELEISSPLTTLFSSSTIDFICIPCYLSP